MLSMDTGYALQHVHVRAANLFCPMCCSTVTQQTIMLAMSSTIVIDPQHRHRTGSEKRDLEDKYPTEDYRALTLP